MENLPPSIAFRLRGTKSNRDAIGAVVTVETELGPPDPMQSDHCKLDRDFFRSTAKTCSLDWEQRRARCARRFAGRAGWCSNSTICRSTTGCGLKKAPSHLEWRPSELRRGQRVHAQLDAKPQEIETLPTTAETWLLAPVEAPDFSLPDFGGQMRTLSALRGKPVLLNFWAAGAERCKEDWITFNQRHAAWAAQGLQLLAVNLDGPADAESVQRAGAGAASFIPDSSRVRGRGRHLQHSLSVLV